MTNQYLLEIGMEEIPARFLVSLSQQLKDRVENFLNDNRLDFEEVIPYSTPRRLAVRVIGLAESQAELHEKAKGPALRIAKNQEGEWTKAALGFARGQGVEVEMLYTEMLNGEEYIFADKHVKGDSAEDVLKNISKVLKEMNFAVTMHWHTFEEEYIRPVHWIVSMFNETVIPFDFLNVKTGAQSIGHRFLGQAVTITHAENYEEQLEKESVLVDFSKRREMILKQIQKMMVENEWEIPIDQDLLDEVTAIVEWPTAFAGQFDKKYLDIPEIILTTAMKDHQRYFYVLNKKSKQLLPYFVSVRNGNEKHIENVIKGNEKVLRARLEDGWFFYQTDLKESITFYNEKLNRVQEHYKLGTLAEKEQRVTQLVQELSQYLDEQINLTDIEMATEAAKIYKFDLMTQVVGEFPELQGEMGQIYGLLFGIDEGVAQAIGSQYLPTSSGGKLPGTTAAALLAVSDKLDTLMNYFAVNLIPTGSNDPYALRRQATGLVEIIHQYQWKFNLEAIIFAQMDADSSLAEENKLENKLIDFIKARVQQFLERHDVEYDIIDATIKAKHLDIVRMIDTANALQNFKKEDSETYRTVVEALTRVVNLGAKIEQQQSLDFDLIETPSERLLMELIESPNIAHTEDAMVYFKRLIEPINDYFDNNMVNTDDAKIKANRRASLKQLTDQIMQYFDPRKLISKF